MSTTESSIADADPDKGSDGAKNVQASTGWVMASYLVHQGVRLAANLILTRILMPDAFALMALVLIVLIGVEMLSDVGIRTSIMRHEDSENPNFYKTAWTVQVMRGVLLSAAVLAISGPMASFYEQPELKNLLMVLALIPLIQGTENIGVYLAERRLRYFKVFLALISEPLIAAPVGVFLAYTTQSVWALAAMSLCGMAARVLAGHIMFRDTRMGFRLDKDAALEMIHFGKWIILSTAIAFFMYQMDRLALGKLVDLTQLGIYSIALMWAEVPLLAARKWIVSILQPLVASWRREVEHAGARASRYRSQVLYVAAIPFGLGVGLGAPILESLYQVPFTEAGTYLTILLVAAWLGLMEEMYVQLLVVWGYPRKRMWACIMAVAIFCIIVWPLFTMMGAYGVAVARVATMAALLIIQWWFWRPHGSSRLIDDLGATALMGAAATVAWFAQETMAGFIGHVPATVACGVLAAIISVIIANRYRTRLLVNPGG